MSSNNHHHQDNQIISGDGTKTNPSGAEETYHPCPTSEQDQTVNANINDDDIHNNKKVEGSKNEELTQEEEEERVEEAPAPPQSSSASSLSGDEEDNNNNKKKEEEEDAISSNDINVTLPLFLQQTNTTDNKSQCNNSSAAASGGGGGGKVRKKRRSSLEMRKAVPMNHILLNQSEFVSTDLHEDDLTSLSGHSNKKDRTSNTSRTRSGGIMSAASSADPKDGGGAGGGPDDEFEKTTLSYNFLRRTCLHSKFKLRTQMMLSFGLVSAFAILLVVVVCIAVSNMCGKEVNEITQQSFEDYVRSNEGVTARYLAESLTLRLLPTDAVQILFEATKDRFQGYPIHEDDSQVPFWDMESKTNRYPIRGEPLPLDWEIGDGNIDDETHREHVQHRWLWYQPGAPLSTSNAAYLVQGSCNPNEQDPNAPSYWPDCSEDNNNMTTGGVVAPSPTNHQVYRKATDLAPVLKSLYEFYLDIKELGIYFANGGSGSTIIFPHYQLDTSTSYESIGCNWLLERHPYDPNRLIGSSEDHSRCEADGVHIKGQRVSTRSYSPMDRDWCRNQAQNPHKVVSYGPYLSAWQAKEWLMSIGRAVYDERNTNEFIGCIGIDYVLNAVEDAVREARVTISSEVTLVRYDANGTVVASSAWNTSEASRNVMIDELDVGVTQATFLAMKELVDFDSQWDPNVVRETFENFHVQEGGFSVTAYPMPPPPDKYDASYRPEFLAISSLAAADVMNRVTNVSESVDDTVTELVILTLAVGLIGLASIILFIFVVSNAITLPLNYMNDVSSDIVSAFGSRKEEGIEMSQTTLESKWSPKTELSDVVKQFQKMVSRFSGSAMARSMQVMVTEIENRFTMEADFVGLYHSREKRGFDYDFCEPRVRPEGCDGDDNKQDKMVIVPSKIHFGSVINDGSRSETTTFRAADVHLTATTTLKSPLFFWIVALVVAPLLITTVIISAFVTYRMSQGFLDIIGEAQGEYLYLNRYALSVYSALRASFAELSMRQSIRNNFLLARFSGWLLFGGLARTEAFTDMFSGTGDCKGITNLKECSAFEEFSCDCAWNDIFQKDGTCEDFTSYSDSRSKQRTVFFGLAEDILPDGDRVNSSYPEVAHSPESTVWWDSNFSLYPGHEKGANATGYGTTYDRFRVMSAMPIYQTLYNADPPQKRDFIYSMVFFEADGLGIGYTGCSIEHLRLSGWSSNEENRAAELRPELCPLGKYGFDPRCRGWYDTGMKLALVNNTSLYVTPPYHFAGVGEDDNFFGQTCTSPLFDPRNGEHVGQTLIDFVSKGIFDALHHNNTPLNDGGFPIVITGLSDMSGADTVIGPDFSLKTDPSSPLGDVVLPYDDVCPSPDCKHRRDFEIIREEMKQGKSGITDFQRTTKDGSTETVHIAYAPVFAKVFDPKNSSDFARGVNVSDFLVYSLALAEPEPGMVAPFSHVEDEVNKQIQIAVGVLVLVILFSTTFVVYISSRITLSMTEPMIYLLQLILHINRMNVDGSPPDVEVDMSYGSKEIVNVVETMETLYRIVQSANVAYFAGDVEKAYYVLADAARLFRRLENSKAEGVANNNLGNIMLAFYRTLEDTGGNAVCGFTKREVIGKGMGYYHRAIQLGEKAYDVFYEEEGWSPSCLEFMQHLSNRYFNRAMFLLTVKDGHERPAELEELGFRDLQIATDMDVEIVDQGTEVGWDIRGADKMFEVFLSRMRGHLLLLEMGFEDKWDIDETLDSAFDLLKKELRVPSSPIFKDFSPAGRMQQIETELMRYKVLKGDLEAAARISIRMLVEDEKTLQEAQLKAVEVLVLFFRDMVARGGNEEKLHGDRAGTLKDLEDYQRKLQRACEERDRHKSGWDEELPATVMKSMRNIVNDSTKEFKEQDDKLQQFRMSSLKASTRGDVTMEDF